MSNIYNIRILVDFNQDNLSNISEYIITLFPNGSMEESSKYKRGLGPYYRIKKDDSLIKSNDCCSICLDNYKPGLYKRTIGCNHTFHKKCIDKWFKSCKDMTCPICRKYHNNLISILKD